MRWEYQSIWPASWEICVQVKKQQWEPDIDQWTGSTLGKVVRQGCILFPCLYAEYITQNAGADEAQVGIKTAWKNINNLKYADDTTIMAESEDELKIRLMKVKEESEKAGLKHNIHKTKIIASIPITMTNLDSILKSRDITFLAKFCLVKAMVFQWSCMDVRVGS